ncbi:MAG: methyltransferase domain-containing protein [Corynebacteriales bacterium]|nr:methyltransferase domain-containing protein [Mycobacteriales bacterium]
MPDTQLRRNLAEELVSAGALYSPEWMAAFEEVPRHLFVGEFVIRTQEGLTHYSAERHEEWLNAVYSDQGLLTQFSQGESNATSSSSQPSVMAAMLEALNLADGDTVLEIGSGTGYNAALLSHRLGSENVISVDIDPALVEAASEHLRQAGFTTTVAAGNGRDGYPDAAPYSAIIATCSVQRIPVAWLAQVKDGGRIVANIGAVLLAFDVKGGQAIGRPLSIQAMFMALRETAEKQEPVGHLAAPPTQARITRLRIKEAVFTSASFRDFLLLLHPAMEHIAFGADLHMINCPAEESAAWIDISTGTVSEVGSRSPWRLLAGAYEQWDAMGQPELMDLRLSIDEEGNHFIDRTGYESVAI